jgi:hypothetical protein
MAINKIPPKPTHRKRSPFYWWRRFPSHKPLSTTQPLLFRIQNGDFEYAPYFEQADWEDHWCEEEIKEKKSLFMSMENYSHEKAHIQMRYAKRRRLLLVDAQKTEYNRLFSLFTELAKLFGGHRNDVEDFALGFEGTTEELYWAYCEHKGGRSCPPTIEEQNILAALHHKNRPKRRGRPPKNSVL